MSEEEELTADKIRREEIRQGHIERFLKGKDAWNEWAEKMLREKKELENQYGWQINQTYDGNAYAYRTMASNKKVQNWLDRTYVDFISRDAASNKGIQVGKYFDKTVRNWIYEISDILGKNINFSEYIFPGDTRLEYLHFEDVVRFSGTQFRGDVWFIGSRFSGVANFDKSTFFAKAYFKDAHFNLDAKFIKANFNERVVFHLTQFSGFTTFLETNFQGPANFYKAHFHHPAFLTQCHFENPVDFENAIFEELTLFTSTKFNNCCHFRSAKFLGELDFSEAVFNKSAIFSLSNYMKEVWFNDATFHDTAHFNHTSFSGYSSFIRTQFYAHVDFSALQCKRGFSLANTQFIRHVPDFSQAHVKEAPRLDNVKLFHVPCYHNHRRLWHLAKQIANNSYGHFRQPRWYIKQQLPTKNLRLWSMQRLEYMWDVFTNHRRDEDEEARYRSLKRLAIQAHDHEKELEFSAGEVRARRYIRDFPWPWQNGLSSTFRYWTGALYDLTSDFGRSLWRPAFLWAIVFCLFSSLYQVNATELAGNACKNSNDMTPSYAANTIAAKNSLLFLGMDRTDKLKRAYACLYGASSLYAKADKAASNPRQKTGYDKLPNSQKHLAPNVPPLVSFLGILHSVLSLSLIFLLLLAIRNQFKIK